MNRINEDNSVLTLDEFEKEEVRQCARGMKVDLEQAMALLADCPPEEMHDRVLDAAALMKKITEDAGKVLSRHRVNDQTVRH